MTIADQITVLLLTYNEEHNIARTLDAVRWARRVLVVDSGSNDATLEILSRYPQVDVVMRPFDSFACQCNFGLSLVKTEWVLSIDADYELSQALSVEIMALSVSEDVAGLSASFIYRIYGRALRSTLYPARTVLYRRVAASYVNEGHGHRVHVKGRVCALEGKIFHDDRKSLSRWFASQQRYARVEAEYLVRSPKASLRRSDRIRSTGFLAPPLVFLYTLIVKGCLLDGWPGWFYVLQRTLAETMLALEIIDHRLRPDSVAK